MGGSDKMPERRMTLAETLVRKVGLRKATSVAAFIVAWGIYSEKEDAPHTMDAYSAFWGQSNATTYRERDLFRICFPEDKLPDRVWGLIRSVYDARIDVKSREVTTAQVLSVQGSWS